MIRLICLFLFIIVWSLDSFAKLPTSNKIEALKNEIEANDLKIQSRRLKEEVAVQDLVVLDRDLRFTETRLKRARYDLQFYSNAIKGSQKKLSTAKSELDVSTEQLADRLREIYKYQNLGFLEVLFSAKDLLSFFETSIWVEKLLIADVSILKDVRAKYVRLLRYQQKLNNQSDNVRRIQQSISNQLHSIEQQKMTKTAMLSRLREQIQLFEKRNLELVESSKKMGVLIQRKSVGRFVGTGSFVKPVLGWISSKFGYRNHPIFKRRIFHAGIDFAAPRGYKIKAADQGVVIFAGRWGGYGNATIIDHGKELTSVYAHQSRIVVKKGQKVYKGQLIGYVGSTGFSTGPHLHFEVRKNGRPINPMTFLKK